jgi:serine phosphatase RsbU (regulator of sigma subunit)
VPEEVERDATAQRYGGNDPERVEQELLVARRIQQASLPKEVPTLEGWHIAPPTSQLGR